MIVMKFGGTSVGSAERIKVVAEIVRSRLEKGPIVVVSAVSKMTDLLIELAKEGKKDTLKKIKDKHIEILNGLGLDQKLLIKDFEEIEKLNEKSKGKELSAKTLDEFQSYGERMSSKIVAAYLTKDGMQSKAYNSFDIGFVTDDNFGEAEILDITYQNIEHEVIEMKDIPVITGFLAKTEDGIITTLGRGGSDYTAAIVGAAINASAIEIWTDVDGIMTMDPRVVKEAKSIEKVSFAEASELAYFGAKVLHPKTIQPAVKKDIPVWVLNTHNITHKGTEIVSKAVISDNIIKAISFKKGVSLVNVCSTRMLGAYGFLARLFDIFYKYKKSVDVIATSEVSVSMTLSDPKNLDEVIKELGFIGTVTVKKNKSIICVVGEGSRDSHGIVGRIFSIVGKNKINVEMISQGASEINTTFVVDDSDAEKAVKALHKEFFG